MATAERPRAPSLFVSHGGGPMPLLGDAAHQPLVDWLTSPAARALVADAPQVRAVLCVTAHWEQPQVTVTTQAQPTLLYDYHGFPPAAYALPWAARARGDAAVAQQIRDRLTAAGVANAADDRRGWDHGVFVPLMLLLGAAPRVPVIQMSVLASQDPAAHLALGRALAPLRDDGIALVASGMDFHNMAALRAGLGGALPDRGAAPVNAAFADALGQVCRTPSVAARCAALAQWTALPGARAAHPAGAAEHLMPLLVAAAAGGEGAGEPAVTWRLAGAQLTCWVWR